jgi:hypothetical protein
VNAGEIAASGQLPRDHPKRESGAWNVESGWWSVESR